MWVPLPSLSFYNSKPKIWLSLMIHVASLSAIHLILCITFFHALFIYLFIFFQKQMDRIHCKNGVTHFFKLSIVLLSMHPQIICHSFQVVLHIPVLGHRLCTPIMLQFLKFYSIQSRACSLTSKSNISVVNG
jgi:hypothetical protein